MIRLESVTRRCCDHSINVPIANGPQIVVRIFLEREINGLRKSPRWELRLLNGIASVGLNTTRYRLAIESFVVYNCGV